MCQAQLYDTDVIGAKRPLRVSTVSPIGQFLRRCTLEWLRLQFSDAHQLWEEFALFREPALRFVGHSPLGWNVRHRAMSNDESEETFHSNILHENLQRQRHDPSHTASSLDDIERVMQFQMRQLQQYGSRVPDGVKTVLRQMIERSSSTPSDVHFLRYACQSSSYVLPVDNCCSFFDAWRSGAYTAAIDHLHRYFDYTVEGHGADQNIKTYHQYALLHLAVLHADFGCYNEAISAMNECIATGQRHGLHHVSAANITQLERIRIPAVYTLVFPGLHTYEGHTPTLPSWKQRSMAATLRATKAIYLPFCIPKRLRAKTGRRSAPRSWPKRSGVSKM